MPLNKNPFMEETEKEEEMKVKLENLEWRSDCSK